MFKNVRPSVIAEPLAAREWQVLAGAWDTARGGRVVGFIEELGGIYEVDCIERPELCQFYDTFKEAIEFFDRLERGAGDQVILQASAAC